MILSDHATVCRAAMISKQENCNRHCFYLQISFYFQYVMAFLQYWVDYTHKIVVLHRQLGFAIDCSLLFLLLKTMSCMFKCKHAGARER